MLTSCTSSQGRPTDARSVPAEELYRGQQHRAPDARRRRSSRGAHGLDASTSRSSPPATASFREPTRLSPTMQTFQGMPATAARHSARAARRSRRRATCPRHDSRLDARPCSATTTSTPASIDRRRHSAALPSPFCVMRRGDGAPDGATTSGAVRCWEVDDTRRFSLRARRAQGRGRRPTARRSTSR